MSNEVNSREKTGGMTVLDIGALQAVSGGWCGTPYPGSWGIPVVPHPEPDPWVNVFSSKLSLVSLNPQPLPPAELQGFTAGY